MEQSRCIEEPSCDEATIGEISFGSSVALTAVVEEMPCLCASVSAALRGLVPRSYISAASCSLYGRTRTK